MARPEGCWSDFDLLTGNQAITWPKKSRHLNKKYARSGLLDELEDFSFDVTHLPSSRNQVDPLTLSGFADGLEPAASTGDSDPDPESQEELFSRLGGDAPC